MELTMKSVRKLGYKKIIKDITDWDDFIIREDRKIPPYIFLKDYSDFCNNSWYTGMEVFIAACEPLIKEVGVSKNLQRRFRNRWVAMWKDFQNATSLEDNLISELSNTALLLSYKEKVDDRLDNFYNNILHLYVTAQSEGYLESVGFSAYKFVEMLVVEQDLSFLRKVG